MRWKSLLLTILISIILFFVMIAMGMKYHWVDGYQNNDKKDIKLAIPEKATNILNDPQILEQEQGKQELNFKAVLLANEGAKSVFSSMTKQQIIDYCETQYRNHKISSKHRILMVGNCVVTHYQDPYQEINRGSNNRNNNAKP